jgi:hypothetical protein
MLAMINDCMNQVMTMGLKGAFLLASSVIQHRVLALFLACWTNDRTLVQLSFQFPNLSPQDITAQLRFPLAEDFEGLVDHAIILESQSDGRTPWN